MKIMNSADLKEMNGKDGKPVYIAHNGKVYDVSGSRLWSTGTHMRIHNAGEDLSAQLSRAPHGVEVFERVPQIGSLQDSAAAMPVELKPRQPGIIERIPFLKRHPHPMLVHFPIAIFLLAPLFYLLHIVLGVDSLEQTSLHCLIAALLFTPLAIATGYMTWVINYHARSFTAVRIKIACSWLLLAMAAIIVVWRLSDPALATPSGVNLLYAVVMFLLAPLVSVIGWFGGQLTFPPE